MSQKKGQTSKKPSQKQIKPISADYSTFTPRLRRLALALATRPHSARELIDVIPCNNPAEYIRKLRNDHGLTIVCEHIKFTTKDGESSWHGRYHLADADKEKLLPALEN